MVKTIAVCNQKGGVGKSTTVFHLARAASLEGMRVCVVDMDPQGNITSALTQFELPEDIEGVADVLSARSQARLESVLVDTSWPHVHLAPTVGDSLALVRDELVVAGAGREGRLRTHLDNLNADLILVDCPPSLDQLTINALTAAHHVLIVTQTKQWSSNGMAHLLHTINAVRTHYNPTLSICATLPNLHEPHTLSGQRWLHQLTTYTTTHNMKLLDPIPKRIAIADSLEAGLGLDEWPAGNTRDLQTTYTHTLEEILS